jgi:hypothetical protein
MGFLSLDCELSVDETVEMMNTLEMINLKL